jgi:folate-binding protein YgfZ
MQAEGAAIVSQDGRPKDLHYGDWEAEYAALTRRAGMAHDLVRGLVEMTGDDRAAFLNRLATNKIEGLPVGGGCETFLTNAKGHVLHYVAVLHRPDALLLLTLGCPPAKLLAHLDHYLIRDRVELHDRSRQQAGLILAGPEAGPLLARQCGSPLPGRYLDHAEVQLASASVRVCSLDSRDLDPSSAYLLIFAAEELPKVWHALRAAGVRPCGQQALETFRIEAGFPRYGRDLTEDNLPQEVGRDRLAISLTKGCYLGQETVARIDSRGHVNRLLCGLVFAAGQVPVPGTELRAGSAAVGEVTSAAFSPARNTAVALGYVRRGHNEPGTTLESAAGPLTVVSLPMQ